MTSFNDKKWRDSFKEPKTNKKPRGQRDKPSFVLKEGYRKTFQCKLK